MTNIERLSNIEFPNYNFSDVAKLHHQDDLISHIRPDKMFILLLGPSAIGKSTLINYLNQKTDNSFQYISPYTTRSLREGEKDKVSISDSDFNIQEASGGFIYVNHLYGVRYGTPLNPIKQAFENGKTPILDFPLDKVSQLSRSDYDLLNIYIFPETSDLWVNKLNECGRNTSGRIEAGINELTMLHDIKQPHPDIHHSIINNYQIDIPGTNLLNFINQVKNK